MRLRRGVSVGISLGDLITLARAALCVPQRDRAALCSAICKAASEAGRFAYSTGRAHPEWGTGSLTSAALRWEVAREPVRLCPDYVHALRTALEVLDGLEVSAEQ